MQVAMTNCLLQKDHGCTDSFITPSSYSFAVELEALIKLEQHDPIYVMPTPSLQSDATNHKTTDLPTSEFSDLGDALASILALPIAHLDGDALNNCSAQFVTERATSASPRRGSDQEIDVVGVERAATEVLHTVSNSPRLSLEETGLSVYSPLSSSIASSSSYEDIASVVGTGTGEKSPQSAYGGEDLGEASTASARAATGNQPRTGSASSDSDDENAAGENSKCNKIIKLPQRKGGMQLWQFLYALLSDPKYKELIEWTSNVKDREFRLHEPESIAIWWGDHKNKRNMSYDKLSRSLRYYYDKGIIRKINGQRYVYRFCVDPEVMYRHIGNSDCRPKLKPMSQSAHNAMSKYNHPYPGMLYPPHPMVPGAAFSMPGHGGHFFQPHHSVLSCSYPPLGTTAATNFLPPSSNFNQTLCGSFLNESPMHYPNELEVSHFQQHQLPQVTQCSPLKCYEQQGGFTTHFPDCLPVVMEEAKFQAMMNERVPSPQSLSPGMTSAPDMASVCGAQSSPTVLSPQSYSPHMPPPYCYDGLQ